MRIIRNTVNVNASVQMLYSVHGGVLWRLCER